MDARTDLLLQLADWAIKTTRKTIPHSTNRPEWSNVTDMTPANYLDILWGMLRLDVGKRGSEQKSILDEIRRKIGIEFLSDESVSDIDTLFPLTLHTIGKKFENIHDLGAYVRSEFKDLISEKKSYTGLSYVEAQVIRAIKNRIGNCGETSALATLLLMEYPDIPLRGGPQLTQEDIKLERFLYKSPGDHSFVVLNRTSSESDKFKISTWNDDAVICDPWIGVRYTIGQWREWKRDGNAPHYIIEDSHGFELNDPFRRWERPYAFVGETHNKKNGIAIHSDQWESEHGLEQNTKNKSFRPVRLISLQAGDLAEIRSIYDAARKGDIAHINPFIKSKSPVINFNAVAELAIENGHIKLFDYLITNKLINIEKDFGLYLKLAIENNHLDIFKALINANHYLPPDKINKQLQQEGINTLLKAAIKNGYKDIANCFFDEFKTFSEAMIKQNGSELLVAVAENGYSEMFKDLIERGIDLPSTYTIEMKNQLLLFACKINSLPILEYLLANGADKDFMSNDGETPLKLACRYGHTEIVKKLIQCGANINATVLNDNSPLFIATQNNHLDIVNILIAEKVRVDDKCRGKTALFIAVMNNNPEIVNALIGANANVDIEYYEHTLLSIAAGIENIKIEIIRDLAKAKANVNFEYYGGSPIVLAAKNGRIDIMQCLLENGADIKKGFENFEPFNNEVEEVINTCRNNQYNLNMLKTILEEHIVRLNKSKKESNSKEIDDFVASLSAYLPSILSNGYSSQPIDFEEILKNMTNDIVRFEGSINRIGTLGFISAPPKYPFEDKPKKEIPTIDLDIKKRKQDL